MRCWEPFLSKRRGFFLLDFDFSSLLLPFGNLLHPFFFFGSEAVFAVKGDAGEHGVHELLVSEDGVARFDVVDFCGAVGGLLLAAVAEALEKAMKRALEGLQESERTPDAKGEEGEEVGVAKGAQVAE
jgi:hypothetical protein